MALSLRFTVGAFREPARYGEPKTWWQRRSNLLRIGFNFATITKLMNLTNDSKTFRILSLDGGGAKGFYTLGVLNQIEAMLGGKPLCERFDLIFGTSTGAIIATLLGLGRRVDEIYDLYKKEVPSLMRTAGAGARSAALEKLAADVYKDLKFDAMKTRVGIVAARWLEEKPMIFKPDPTQAHGMKASFVPGFGCTVADAVVASCSAYPLFNLKVVKTFDGPVKLLDGGYCANNPSLYAIADAVKALGMRHDQLRPVSVDVGVYPEPPKWWHDWLISKFFLVQLLHKTLGINVDFSSSCPKFQ
jgi:uncharacterized protein